jgi:hypothetical protein
MEQTASDICVSENQKELESKIETKNSKALLTRRQGNNPKLTQEQVIEMLGWIAEFKSLGEIVSLLKEKFNVSLNRQTIEYYKAAPKWQGLIKKYRDQWGTEIFHLPLAHKRRRLEELEKIYYETYSKKDYKLALESLDKIKHETEKDLQNLHLYNIRVYKNMSDEELESERLKTLEEIKKIKELTHANKE